MRTAPKQEQDNYKLQKVTDDELVKRFLASQDQEAFKCLIQRNLVWLRRLLYTLFNGNLADIEDAEQEILIGIFTDMHTFKYKSSFKTFFYSYARNKAIDILRKISHEKGKIERFTKHVFTAEATNPEDKVIKKEIEQQITTALKMLDPDDRVIIIMKDVEDFSIKEIATILKIAQGTIKSRLHRIREKLAKILTRRII